VVIRHRRKSRSARATRCGAHPGAAGHRRDAGRRRPLGRCSGEAARPSTAACPALARWEARLSAKGGTLTFVRMADGEWAERVTAAIEPGEWHAAAGRRCSAPRGESVEDLELKPPHGNGRRHEGEFEKKLGWTSDLDALDAWVGGDIGVDFRRRNP